ncbi:MAG: alanine--tRNA ligase-related protein [Candidatus Bathyarchaeia archaeon]
MSMVMNEMVKIFQKEFDESWHAKQPLGLVSPYFPNTFNPSGGHDVAGPTMLNPNPQALTKFYTVERCFRDIDVGIVGLSHHLSYFEMLTFGACGFLQENREVVKEVVDKMAHLLFEVFRLERDKVFVAYFSGGKIASTFIPGPTDEELNIWRKHFQLHLIPVPGRRTFIYAAIEDWPAGPGFEIFYDRGDQFPETVRFIEIASINFYKYLNRSGSLHEAVNWAIGGGIGLERLAMIVQQAPTIYDIDIFQEIKKALDGRVNQEEMWLFRKSYNIVMDHLRAVIFILMDGQRVDSTPRGKILRRLMKRTASQLAYVNLLDESIIDTFYEKVTSIYECRFIQLREQRDSIVGTIKNFLTRELGGEVNE